MSYKPQEGTENKVHLRIQKGGFDPVTGKRIGKPFVHITTPAETHMFLENRNGHNIIEFLHVPETFKLHPPKKIDKDTAPKAAIVAYKAAKKEYKKLSEMVAKAGSKVEKGDGLDDTEDDDNGGNEDIIPGYVEREKVLNNMTVPDINPILESHGLPIEGNKGQKIEAILDVEFPN